MVKVEIERQELRLFSHDVRIGSARNLKLLRAIDGAIAWLIRLTSQIRADAIFAEKLTEEIITLSIKIDEKGDILETFAKAQSSVHGLYELLIAKRKSAEEDVQLTEDDGVECAYDEAIAAAADLHNNLNALRWAIAEHDADLSPVSKTYDNIEELLGDLEA